MPSSLEEYTRQCVFIVKEGAGLRRVEFTNGFNGSAVATSDELLSSLVRASTAGQRPILIVSEDDFQATRQLLRHRALADGVLRSGIVVVASEPKAFLHSHDGPDVLDVVNEKELKKSLDVHLSRAVRHLFRIEERGQSKVGRKTLEKLNEIFIALSAERNPQKLLAAILLKAMDLTRAHGGTLYMVQETDGEMYFRLKISNDGGEEVIFQNSHIKAAENSICGYVALTGKLLNIADVSNLRPLTFPAFHKSLDHNNTDRTKSLLTIPLKNSRNEILGVLQLANHRNENEKPTDFSTGSFELEDETLLSSFGTQAAICLENVDLYADIQRLFEGFVKAAIAAIESRDPSTGGHSERVAKMCVALARATTECEVGIYRSVRFKEEEIRELEYAALLHDFGKIGVREEVLVKAKKLYPYQLDAIQERIKICKAAARIVSLEKRLKQGGSVDAGFEREYQDRVKAIDAYWQIILAANEPTVLKKENMEALERIRTEQLLLPDGAHIALLTEDEYKALQVTRGSLTENERLEIESHVRHTFQFLKMIPWTRDFKHLTEIAYCHHEKLDGSGYPRGLSSHAIPLQSKIMTIADIYDALTAADRWYKEAVPTEKALEILAHEVNQGKLDPVLFELFVEKKIFELTNPVFLNQVA